MTDGVPPSREGEVSNLSAPTRLYIQHAEDGTSLRKWSPEPFEGGVEYVRQGWLPIESAEKSHGEREGAPVMLWNGARIGEGLFVPWGGEPLDDAPDGYVYDNPGAWRWANDSCSCCWEDMEPQPTHWQPLPPAPEQQP